MNAFDLPPWLATAFVFVFGTVVGSFLNVCVYRLPQHAGLWASLKGLTHPPSRCPRCGTPIRTSDNLPVIGWLRLRGRCRACRTKIPVRYPGVEFINGLLLVAVYWYDVPAARFASVADAFSTTPFGPTSAEFPLADVWHVHARFAFHAVLCELLLVASLIDFDLQIIPKAVTDPAVPAGILGMSLGGMYLLPITIDLPYFAGGEDGLPRLTADGVPLVPAWVRSHPHLHGLACGVAGALAGALPVLGVRWIGGAILRQEAVGLGDVWLMAAAGAFLGWQPTLVALLLSLIFSIATVAVVAVLGLLRIGSGTMIPYGPFLAAGSAAALFGWPWIWPRTMRLFSEMVVSWPITLGFVVTFGVALGAALILVQFAKRLLGIRPLSWPEGGDWTPADQAMYQAGERPGLRTGLWPGAQWPGGDAGRGQQYLQHWRGDNRPI